jgi:hypothetical protein
MEVAAGTGLPQALMRWPPIRAESIDFLLKRETPGTGRAFRVREAIIRS